MSIRTAEHLASAIRRRRKHLGITQRNLALTCGTGLRFIIDLEKGKPTCQIGKTLAILQALGLTLEVAPRGGKKGDRS